MTDKSRATALAERTSDAYSWDAYGQREWFKLCHALVKAGLTDEGIEALVRSKHTRWSRDAMSRYRGTASDFLIYYIGQDLRRPGFWRDELAQLIRETF